VLKKFKQLKQAVITEHLFVLDKIKQILCSFLNIIRQKQQQKQVNYILKYNLINSQGQSFVCVFIEIKIKLFLLDLSAEEVVEKHALVYIQEGRL